MTEEPVVLVVDSSPDSLDALAAVLRARGYRPRTATGGAQALAWVRSHPPALILVAAHLSDMKGSEVCSRLKRYERSRHIPVILVAGGGDEQAEGISAGASDFISLPLRWEEVVARVQTHLELSQLRAAVSRAGESRAQVASSPDPDDSHAWIRLALQAGRMYAFEWNTATDEVFRSPSCTEILGNDPDARKDTGQNWFRRVHPDDVDQLRRVLAILSPAYDMYDMRYRVRRCDGRLITIRESSRGFFDGAKRLTRVIGIVADVSEQMQAESDLEHTQSAMLQLIQNLPIAVAIADVRGRIQYVNDSFQRNFGYQLDEIAAPEAWWQRAYPDEEYRREVIATWEEAVQRAIREDQAIPPQEYYITGKDGSLHTVEISGATLGDRKLILFDDVTERKRSEAALRESEERFRLMADTAPVLLWVSGPDKLYTFFNRGWLEFTGRTMDQELGNGWAASVHPDDLERCLTTYTEAFDGRQRFQMEYRLRRADGEYRWLLDTGVPRFARDGTFAGYLGSCIDLTEFKRNQEQMLAAQKLESLGVLASGIAHDFNNLLGCILVDTNATVSELEPGSPARDGLERIEAVAVRASEIVRQIMTYAGQSQQDMETVNIAELVREMLRLLQVCIPKGVRLELDLPSDLPNIRASAAQIRQVVMNLVLNAGEAFGDRNGSIHIAALRERLEGVRAFPGRGGLAKGDYVRLVISDTGSGMPEEVRTRIFDPFFTTKIAGRGLGLAAVQGIVRSHGGAIDVTSTPGRGTRFEILLPCATGAELRIPAPPPRPEPLRSDKGSILIVEDEDTLRFSVSRMLRKRGFSVLEAGDGDLAVNLIRAQDEDIAVVLLDLTLPGKSSLEVFEELQRTRPGVKVILTSAYGREGVPGSLRALRHESFIRKPYHLSELVSVVRSALLPVNANAPKQN
jgi:PAS domain S-box-containing protein